MLSKSSGLNNLANMLQAVQFKFISVNSNKSNQHVNLQGMFQRKSEFRMSGCPPSSMASSNMAIKSAAEVDILEGTEQRLIQQGIPEKDQVTLYKLSGLRNIKKTITELQSQLLQEEGNKLIPKCKMEEIRSKFHIVETELEEFLKKYVKNSNSQYPDDFHSQKVSYIAELEKKIQTYEEKLRQTMKRQGQLQDEVKKLNAMVSALNDQNFSKEELHQLSLGTARQAVLREKLVQVEAIAPIVGLKQRQGLEHIRKCTPEEQSLIAGEYLNIQNQLKKKGENILIYYTFRNDKLNETCGSQEIHQWVKKLIEEIEPGAGCYPVVQCFILNPKENQLSQDYHMDYIEHMRTLFVSMDYLTTLNSTQFFKEPLKNYSKLSLRGGKQYGNDEKEILNRQDREFMEVSQMICKPYNILRMKPGTVHRGIANRSGVDRVVFSVCYTNVKGYLSGEPKIATQKQDIE